MKKDKWWLKQEISEIFWRAEIDNNLNIQGANLIFDKIDNAIDQLDEPKKPVIPRFVADYIEKWKHEDLAMRTWFTFDYDNEEEDEVAKWLYDNNYEENTRREYLLIDAIRYGYEVEKEKKYIIQISEVDFMVQDSEGFLFPTDLNIHNFKSEFTESQIKAIDKRYWAFAEEVKE